ncbi:hypothetical protein RYY30_003505 [Vibrio cholerae]|uniref:hypothetical protein n=1 Tax=Vibrio cholerae TaxID=666 RepID=UPI000323A40D|nr:hypothetical protein [Vibrio cholerae]EGQ8122500.1 hypothetical protein [Vibrio cholerae]EGR0495389.1 hypothetical protein [Vibrio cholerae]EJL6335995.1 hypothetical protein [Vibrio cholerae]EJL6830964.1 hypothetical protein [Vibrio cholerae]EJL7009280.1 hypothetical protein [Vibrio cholerae]
MVKPKTYHYSPNTPILRDIAIGLHQSVKSDSTQSIPCIVFCASVLESFINETYEFRRYLPRGDGAVSRYCYTIREYAFEMYRMVEERERLQDKYYYALKTFSGSDSFKSESIFESFKILIEIRNHIVHNKAEIMVTDGVASKPNININQYPKFIRQLKGKRVIQDVDGSTSWIDLIQSEQVANWSIQTMKDMINLFIESLPEGEYRDCFIKYYQ